MHPMYMLTCSFIYLIGDRSDGNEDGSCRTIMSKYYRTCLLYMYSHTSGFLLGFCIDGTRLLFFSPLCVHVCVLLVYVKYIMVYIGDVERAVWDFGALQNEHVDTML